MTALRWCNLLQGGSKGVPRRFTPILKGVREEVQDGMYTLVSGTAGRDTLWWELQPSNHQAINTFERGNIVLEALDLLANSLASFS